MSYWLIKGIQELEAWEPKILNFLSESLSPDAITYYFYEHERDFLGLYERSKNGSCSLTPSSFDAISSISQIRVLLEEIKQPITESITAETAARFALLSFRAGLTTGMAAPGRGVEVLELDNHNLNEQQHHAGKKAIRESSVKASDARYASLREFKEQAASVAKSIWESGSTQLHHQMAKHLETTYQNENGSNPFWHLPGKDIEASPSKVLLKVVKQVAKDINRMDLISGQKKSP